MSIISDALKKVEGSSATAPEAVPLEPPAPAGAAPVLEATEPKEGFATRPSPPLFSVWSIVLSTIMVLIATVLLLLTWHTNRTTAPTGDSTAADDLAAPPATAVAALPEPAAVAPPAAVAATPITGQTPAAARPAERSAPRPAVAPVVETADKQGSSPETRAVAATSPAADEMTPETPPVVRQRDELELTGIVFTSQVRMAHINGKILAEGSEIAGYRIVRISRESVRLSKDGKYYVLQPKR